MLGSGRGAEDRAVLHFAHDRFQPKVGLQREMLRVLIANGTEAAPKFVGREA